MVGIDSLKMVGFDKDDRNTKSVVLLFVVTDKLCCEDYDNMELFGYFSMFQTQYSIYLAQNRRFLVWI